jgi:hypothetical protein
MQTIKNLLQKPSNAAKTEFWAVTTVFVFFIFFFVTRVNEQTGWKEAPYLPSFEKAGVPFDFYRHYFIPQMVRYVFTFLAFLYLNFRIILQLVMRQALVKNIVVILLLLMAGGWLFGFTNTYLKAFLYAGAAEKDTINRELLINGFLYALSLLFSLGVYTIVKYAALFILGNASAIYEKHPFFRPEGLVATAIWLMGLLLLGFGGADGSVIIMWIIIISTSIFIYLLNFQKIIIKSLRAKFPLISYVLRNLLILPLLLIAVEVILMFTKNYETAPIDIALLNIVVQLFITVPLTWILFKRHSKRTEEMSLLKKELKQSTANIDFLRSQINPHFLFNALNTIYGTAIQEGAERTSEGIEKLGDMMRFMLQENVQEKIALDREIEYLNNYISLQKLRTDISPEIQINTRIHRGENFFRIAPMLLIPFVENAFKHGISFREPSHINIMLEIKNNTLYFEVYNSRHTKMENDPEKDSSGIGLENVKQRLQLIYPNKHKLMIQETTKEFYIHLTLQLT